MKVPFFVFFLLCSTTITKDWFEYSPWFFARNCLLSQGADPRILSVFISSTEPKTQVKLFQVHCSCSPLLTTRSISCMVPLISFCFAIMLHTGTQALTALQALMSWFRLVHAFTAYTKNVLMCTLSFQKLK